MPWVLPRAYFIGVEMDMILFQTRSVLLDYGISPESIITQLRAYGSFEEKEYTNTDEAVDLLLNLTDKIQHKMVERFIRENTYDSFLKL